MNTSIKTFYKENYPDDPIYKDIAPQITFQDLYTTLVNNPNAIYNTIGTMDTIVRERLFTQLAILTDTSYDHIYDLWIK